MPLCPTCRSEACVTSGGEYVELTPDDFEPIDGPCDRCGGYA